MIDLEVPPEVQITMDLAWSGRNVARMGSAAPGDSLQYDATLPPGDYSLWLSSSVPGPERYTLRIDPVDPLSPPDDAEPNDDPEHARPLPEDGTASGVLDPRMNNGTDIDYYLLAPLDEASDARLLVDGEVTVELIAPATRRLRRDIAAADPGEQREPVRCRVAAGYPHPGQSHRHR